MPGRDSSSLVSVIIPTYNRSDMLRLTVESVLAQTYPNVEIIVVDDGSTDDTAEVMAQYAGQVTYFKLKASHGSAWMATKTGINAASGEYISILDHDDLFMPTKLERQVQVLDSRPEIGLVHCRYYHMDAEGNFLDKVGLLPEGEVLKELVNGCFIWSGAPLIRRECLDQPRLFNGRIWYSHWGRLLRIAQAGYLFACVQEPLGAYRILPSGQMADSVKLGRLGKGTFELLDKVFADPGLPADVVAVKEQAYGNTHFWISALYYAARRWDFAQRNLTEALTLCPELLEHPEDLSQRLSESALGPRVANPIQFVNDVFDHLPACANGVRPYRSHALSRAYVGLALRNYGLGDIARAKDQLTEAVGLEPAMLEQTEGFAQLLTHHALRLPISDPIVYVNTVLQDLPTGAERLASVRRRVLSDVSIECAFQDYFAGRRRPVVRQVLTALRYRPSWLGNRGVVSILLRSLLGLMLERWHTRIWMCANDESRR